MFRKFLWWRLKYIHTLGQKSVLYDDSEADFRCDDQMSKPRQGHHQVEVTISYNPGKKAGDLSCLV